jgi:ribosome-associated protein
MLRVNDQIEIPLSEVDFSAVRASGPGGQNVNKVSSAIHLRFDIPASSLPEEVKDRLLKVRDKRLTTEGVMVIKAQSYRDQEKNREDALERLKGFIQTALHRPKKRIPTQPGKAAKRRRVDNKTRRGKLKQMRQKVSRDD